MNLTEIYQNWLDLPESYYEALKGEVLADPAERIQSQRFLQGIQPAKAPLRERGVTVSKGDIRIDVPLWFGNPEQAAKRIIIVGREPRHTDNAFNTERNGDHVYGSPFGVDRWNEKSSVKRKPQNRYFRVFKDHIERPDLFLLFTDCIKEFRVIDAFAGQTNDSHAHNNFENFLEKWKPALIEEIETVEADVVVGLGNEANNDLRSLPFEYQGRIKKIRHPANGGEKKAKDQMKQIV